MNPDGYFQYGFPDSELVNPQKTSNKAYGWSGSIRNNARILDCYMGQPTSTKLHVKRLATHETCETVWFDLTAACGHAQAHTYWYIHHVFFP